MTKNGLFLMSIGMLIFLYSVNQNTLQYNFFTLILAILLVGLGTFFVFKDRQKNKQKTK